MNNLKRGMMVKKYKKKYHALQGKYNELIMAVSKKYPNESRHATALRYIQEAENITNDSLGHPESVCSNCGGPNITWSTTSEVWNKYNGSPNGILCPVCFVLLAEQAGFKKLWRLIPEGHGMG